MSHQAEYYVPADDVLRELGRLQVLHGQLDHALRITIKRLLDISIDDPGYWCETRGMASALREKARKLIDERFRNDEDANDVLNKVLDDAEGATELRNRAIHAVWMTNSEREVFLHDRDSMLKTHINYYQPPSMSELIMLSERIQRIHRVLDGVTRKLL